MPDRAKINGRLTVQKSSLLETWRRLLLHASCTVTPVESTPDARDCVSSLPSLENHQAKRSQTALLFFFSPACP
jgi:hypothetical protein